ncbi:MAG: hypothetical protein H0V89_14790 [Deltaproteobacteria bacterium]|nr:hypothetical protein [Deltaproteobacteria bacterium]
MAVIWYGDRGELPELIEEVESLLPPGLAVTRAAETRAATENPGKAVLLVSEDEADLVADLEVCRDQLLDRTAPMVVFLMRGGTGQRQLAESPGFASWVRGSDPDPHQLAQIDRDTERAHFESETGATPEAWLAAERPSTTENLARHYRAWLLARR